MTGDPGSVLSPEEFHRSQKALSPQKTEKKRKVTHAERKRVLEKEIQFLESGVAVRKTKGLSPQIMLQKDSVLRPVVVEHAALLYNMNTQQLHVAKMQAALSRCLVDQQFYPLYTHINLGKDQSERRAALVVMRGEKLRSALEFIMAPERLTDPFKPHFSENKFETADGDLCCVRYETVQFPGVDSLEQVVDAMLFYKTNMEFIITEQLGHIMLRDDYDSIESKAHNTRVLTTDDRGITTEGNLVSFRHVFGTDNDGYVGEPCAIMAVDTVDEDELYPYLSSERVRRDVSSAVVLTSSRNPNGELIVTMRRAAFLKVHRPEFPLTELEFVEIYDGMMQWSEIMGKTMREILYTKS
ncbi:hypothetical protein BBJ29_004342 [Phytophthora kernoviae]|uniref:Uncharacterized protein n=1 Tax=Phytophthora kernoviae TaxID=325452 RepID=A0A3F2RWX8_9STRA|nr:hypothetical protein BBJ29_004342 [Phytophthora kernoviae]RLN65866.1 hypothetical protein BBP00_00002591 [Phytophthora kernoviae]